MRVGVTGFRGATALAEIVRKNINQLLHQIHCGIEAEVGNGMIMYLAVVCHSHMAGEWHTIDLDPVGCMNDDTVAFVTRLSNGFALRVLVFLGFLDLGRVLLNVLGNRLGRWRRTGFSSAHRAVYFTTEWLKFHLKICYERIVIECYPNTRAAVRKVLA